mgnify:CR=1 FL=1
MPGRVCPRIQCASVAEEEERQRPPEDGARAWHPDGRPAQRAEEREEEEARGAWRRDAVGESSSILQQRLREEAEEGRRAFGFHGVGQGFGRGGALGELVDLPCAVRGRGAAAGLTGGEDGESDAAAEAAAKAKAAEAERKAAKLKAMEEKMKKLGLM